MKNEVVAISVLLPVYNAEKYIKETVESILSQTFTNFEFIIINDGSTDRSLEILQYYAEQDSRIKLISRNNKGLVDTINEGLSLAVAPYIAQIDHDDISLPSRFAIEYDFLQNNPDVVCVGSDYELIDDQSRCIGLIEVTKGSSAIEQSLLEGVCPIANPSTLVLRSAINAVGGYKQGGFPAQDYVLWIDLLDVGKIENINATLLQYRIHAESASRKRNAEQVKIIKATCKQACLRRGIPCVYDDNDLEPEKERTYTGDLLRYGWYAFNTARRRMALEYAIKAIFKSPFSLGGWRLFVCSLIKPLS